MQTGTERKASNEAYEVRASALQAVYDNFHYTDAQHARTIQFVAAAMTVIRGDAAFDSLEQLLPVRRLDVGQQPSNSVSHAFDARFLNEWTSIYVNAVPKRDGTKSFEPMLFQIDLRPEMTVSRERLEQQLQLKVVPGWTADGGNLRWEMAPLEGLAAFNGGVFVYSPLKQPGTGFNVEVVLTYLNGPDQDPCTANRLSTITISRTY